MSAAQNEKTNLLGKSREELCAVAVSLGENAYRGAQLYHALYAEKQFNIAAMTNLGSRLEAVPLRNRVKKSSGASQRIAGFRKSESCGDAPKQS